MASTSVHSQPQKNITLSFSAWAKLMSKLNEIDVEVRELNRQTRRVAYKLQLQKRVYLSVTDGYKCVDIRSFYIPYGLEDTPRNEKPTKSGIALRISDWVQFLTLAAIIDATHPQLVTAAAVAANEVDEEATVMSLFNPASLRIDRVCPALPTLNCHACM